MQAYSMRSDEKFLLAHPGQVLPTDLTNEILCQIARLQLDCLTPSGWEAAGRFIADCIASGDLHSLCLYDPDVLDLTAADQYRLRQCLALFSKRVDIDLGVDRKAAASHKFWEAERICKLVNTRFRNHACGRYFEPRVEAVLHMASRKIASVLGTCPSLEQLRPRLGPGASTQVPKKNACLAVKLEHVPACSTNLADHLEEVMPFAIAGDVGLAEEFLDVPVHFSKLSFVPKNAKSERAICTEPQLNSQFQLAIGDVMARRLLKATGINIKDQSANQRAAQYGSIDGSLATLDLSAASDSIAMKLVEHLLPNEWFELLCRFRTAEVLYEGGAYMLEKVSSMGNGFTFPLETLLFWALASSAVEYGDFKNKRRTLVYGDDIVVDARASKFVIEVLETCGFTINIEKSFVDGTFRESCGADFVLGINVRPVFVKDKLSFLDALVLHNGLLAADWDNTPSCDYIKSIIHPSLRLSGPCGYGDGHLHDPGFAGKPYGEGRGWGGFSFESFALRPKLLKRSLLSHYCDKKGVWHAKCHALARRVATYSCEYSVKYDGSVRYLLDPGSAARDRAFTVPGSDGVKRMKIYIL